MEAPKVEKKKPAKNLLFDPSGLKSSSLFKKIAAVNKSESDTEEAANKEVDKEEQKTIVIEKPVEPKSITKQSDFFADPFPEPILNVPSPKNVIKSEASSELFEEIEVDKAFMDNTFKSAQKVSLEIKSLIS